MADAVIEGHEGASAMPVEGANAIPAVTEPATQAGAAEAVDESELESAMSNGDFKPAETSGEETSTEPPSAEAKAAEDNAEASA